MANTPGREDSQTDAMTALRLRDYAIGLYGRPGVSPACLLLQTRKQIDVNVLLFAAWAVDAGRAPSAQTIADAQARVHAWHKDVVRPIRQVRQLLKSGPPPAPSAATDHFREKLKKLEIESELIELDCLESCMSSMDIADKNTSEISGRVAKALTLIVADAGQCAPGEDEAAAILHIATAAQAYAEERAHRASTPEPRM